MSYAFMVTSLLSAAITLSFAGFATFDFLSEGESCGGASQPCTERSVARNGDDDAGRAR